MSWLVTATGHELDILNPNQANIDGLSVAWALAQVNRFNGHALRPYSVAEHSLLVCEIATHMGLDVHGRFAALLHDAHEAFSGDMHSPGKHAIGPDWHRWENHWASTVQTAFACRVAMHQHAAAIKQADLIALATERRDLLPTRACTPWPMLQGIEPLAGVDLASRTRTAKGWEHWRDAWLDKYHELETERTDALFPTKPSLDTIETKAWALPG